MRRVVLSTALLCAAACLVPVTSFAQVAIAGVVKDGTGAVLPGVTVEASSPALIEKSRTAVSDTAGQYKIVDLGPGTYRGDVHACRVQDGRRDDIILEGNFTAQVNPELQVGSVEESLTVTGATPAVDVINTSELSSPTATCSTHSDDRSQHPGARAAHSRHHGDAVRARPVQPHQPRVVDLRLHDRHRRPAGEQPVRQRAVQRLLHERRERPGADLQHRLGVGGNPEQRHPRQQRAEGRRQQVLRLILRARPGQLAAVRQPLGRREGRPRASRSPAPRTTGRSTRRLADRSPKTSPGSTSPTSTRTARSTCRARISPTAARPTATRWATTAASAASRGRRRAKTRFASTSRSSSTASSSTASTPTADHDAGSVDRRLRPRLDPPGAVDARAVEQAAVRGRPRLLQPAVRTELHGEIVKPTALPQPERLDRPADGRVRLHDSRRIRARRRTTARWRRRATSPARTRSRSA